MTDVKLTARQHEALDWLRSVGKASEKLVRRNGFAVRTFDALADAGAIERAYMPRGLGASFKTYRPLKPATPKADD